MRTSTTPRRFDDRHPANRLEAQAADLRDRLRCESGRDQNDTLDEFNKLEAQLSKMHC